MPLISLKNRRGGGGAAPAADPDATIAAIINAASGEKGFWPLDRAANMAELYTDSVGNVVDGDPVGLVEAYAGNLRLEQQTSAQRPTWVEADGGVQLSGGSSGDGLRGYGATSWTDPYCMMCVVKPDNSQTKMSLFNRYGTAYYAFYMQASASDQHNSLLSGGGSNASSIDGTDTTGATAGTCWSAVNDNAKHLFVLDAFGAAQSGFAVSGGMSWGDSPYSQFDIKGIIYDILLLETPSAADRTTLMEALADKHGITLA